jgi:hypothetical protein
VANGLSCGMTIRPNGRPVTVACSDPLAAQVDEVQYRLDDGPCLHAMRQGILVRIDDTAERARWPRFESKAASHGIGSCLALPLTAGPPTTTRSSTPLARACLKARTRACTAAESQNGYHPALSHETRQAGTLPSGWDDLGPAHRVGSFRESPIRGG